jgi:sugar/nucleoside kinase (ribokinase family)
MQPAIHNGFMTDKRSVADLGSEVDLNHVREGLDWADVVVFHRPEKETYHDLAKMLKEKGKKIVADNDDTFRINAYHPLADFTPEGVRVELENRNESITRFMRDFADLVTCSTTTLKDEYLEFNKNTIVLPNCMLRKL